MHVFFTSIFYLKLLIASLYPAEPVSREELLLLILNSFISSSSSLAPSSPLSSSLSSDRVSVSLVAMFSSVWVSEKIGSRILNRSGSFTSELNCHCLPLLRPLFYATDPQSICILPSASEWMCLSVFASLSLAGLPLYPSHRVAEHPTLSFKTCSNICRLADLFRAKVSKVRANSLLLSASTMANCSQLDICPFSLSNLRPFLLFPCGSHFVSLEPRLHAAFRKEQYPVTARKMRKE